MRRTRIAIGALALVIGLSGCAWLPVDLPSGSDRLPTPEHTYPAEASPDRVISEASDDVKPPGFADAPGDDLQAYAGQQLSWTDCGGYRCATFLVPLDWHDPGAQAITVAMKMRPASAEPHLGPLFINPGGPGGSAQDYVDGFPTSGLEQFDVIGLDSRGSGESTPVVCGTGAQTDAYFDADFTPDDQSEREALIAGQRAFNQECRDNSGALLDHISTVETSYDYDLARRLLGVEKLSFLGTSYGTYLGAVYAELYPTRISRMVLDSAVNPQPDSDVIQAEGFDRNIQAFAAWCATDGGCGLGESEQQVIDAVVAFIDSLDAHPLAASGGRLLTQSQAVSAVALYFYFGSDVYQELAAMLRYATASADGSYLLQVADTVNDRQPDGSYAAMAYAFPAISCADEADHGVQAAFDDWTGRNRELAPVFGRLFGPNLVCPLWTAKAAPSIDFTGKDAPPILIVQNTGDPATPYENGEMMASELESATLVTREAAGHGAYDAGSGCIDWIVVDYLVNGTVPAVGTRCTDG
ncbi:alpha/beta hydrolase [Brooklawnia sp.]|uniref:alpha/beta hydrolase n=1 Tax=Brooklawnia sp. TaxID=2699740 RepID=UPI00311F1D0F